MGGLYAWPLIEGNGSPTGEKQGELKGVGEPEDPRNASIKKGAEDGT